MADLQRGGNAPVSGDSIAVTLDWCARSGVEADASAYLLTEAGKVRGDEDMVFYNQNVGGGGAIRYETGGETKGMFAIDLAAIPSEIARIVFCVTIDEAIARAQTLGMVTDARIGVGPRGGTADTAFAPALAGATEAAMTFGELYKRNGQWKFRAIGQGFNGGLGPLARSFGIEVGDSPRAEAKASPPVRLAKVSLDKPRQMVRLEKRGDDFGEIVVNLNWSRGTSDGSATAIDLDLGCLYELQDGTKMVVQPNGNLFGNYIAAPYIALSGDDRTGDVSAGETLRINGAHWNKLRRLAVFAHIYQGVPNWALTDGVVTVTMPDQPPIEVRMTEGRDDMRLCGVLLLENDEGQFKVTRIADYFGWQLDFDRALGWGLNWREGYKDER